MAAPTSPCDVKILLANSEPSTHGTYATFPSGRRKADISPKPDIVLVYVYALNGRFLRPRVDSSEEIRQKGSSPVQSPGSLVVPRLP